MKPRKHGRDPIAVIDPQGRWHASMTLGAFANGVRPTTAMVNAKLARNGWRLATEQDRPAETNGSAGS